MIQNTNAKIKLILDKIKLILDYFNILNHYLFSNKSISPNQQSIVFMSEKCWKELKSQLCPKDRWVKDDEATKCLCCNKQFRVLFRRKHHCRFCGNIFCSDCSDLYLNGNYLGLPNQKYVRHCEFCHKKINKFISQFMKSPQIFDDGNHEASEDSIDEQNQTIFNLNRIFQQVQSSCQISNKLQEQIQQVIDERSGQLCEKFNIDGKIWKQKLAQITFKAASEVRMDALANQSDCDALDIAKQVKVKTVITDKNKTIQALVKGIVIEKNPISKHMQLNISKPEVMIIENSIDLDSFSSFIKFQELIKNDKQYLKKIVDKILKLNPDIIFVEKHVHLFALQCLQEKEIMVVTKVKPKTLELIKQLACIKKSVKKLWKLQKYKKSQIIGKCDKVYFKKIKEGQSFMFLQSDTGMRTLILGDQRQDLSTLLKRTAQILLKMSRQIFLQKQWILIDQQLKGTCNKNMITTLQDFDIDRKYSSVERFLASQELYITKIIYKQQTFDQVPKSYNEYAQKMELFYKYFKQPCGNVDYLTRKLYSNSDLSFGAFLILTAANFERPCTKCLRNHRTHYYYNGKLVSVETQRITENQQSNENTSSFIGQFSNQEQVTLDKLKNHLIKSKQLVVIQNMIRCLRCNKRISCQQSKIKLGRLYLSNSFYYILERLIYESDRDDMNQFNRQSNGQQQAIESLYTLKKRIPSLKCPHDMIGRVYQYSGIRIKFFIQPVLIRTVDQINFTDPQSQKHILEKEKAFVKGYQEKEIVEKISLLQKIKIKLNDLPFPINVSNTVSQKIKNAFENCAKITDILENLSTEMMELKHDFIQNQVVTQDWTILSRRILKVERVIELCFLIVDEIEIFLRKKISQDYVKNESSVARSHRSFAGSTSSQSLLAVSQKQDSHQMIEGQISVQGIMMDKFSTFINESDRNLEIATPTFPIRKYESYLQTEIKDFLKVISKKRFPRVQGVYFHFCTGVITEPISLLACAFNSSQFKKVLEEEIQNKKKQNKEDKSVEYVEFRMHMLKKIKTQWAPKIEADKLYTELVGDNLNKIQVVDFIFYYPVEFQKLRKREGIDNELYLKALYSCRSWQSSGGKTNSKFAKAENDLLVVKVINEKQFDQFLKFAKQYLEYIKKHRSLLAKIFGIYEIQAKGKVHKCVVMQNIFFKLEKVDKVYDLKGSEVNRLTIPTENKKSFTGQDTNFIIDKEGEPYLLNETEHNLLISTLEGDSIFLRSHQVIDYSLLVIESENRLRVGIIDYMRPYHTIEKIENIYKQLKSGKDPTVIPPTSYAERFVNAMKKYFIRTN